MWSSDSDPYACSDLDRVLEREADTMLAGDDPAHGMHGFPVAETWACDWLVQLGGRDEFGNIDVVECGAAAHEVGAGWACAAGHRHLGIERDLAPWGPAWEREQYERAEAA